MEEASRTYSCVYCGGDTRDPMVCTYCGQWACHDCVTCSDDEGWGGWLCELCTAVLSGEFPDEEEESFDAPPGSEETGSSEQNRKVCMASLTCGTLLGAAIFSLWGFGVRFVQLGYLTWTKGRAEVLDFDHGVYLLAYGTLGVAAFLTATALVSAFRERCIVEEEKYPLLHPFGVAAVAYPFGALAVIACESAPLLVATWNAPILLLSLGCTLRFVAPWIGRGARLGAAFEIALAGGEQLLGLTGGYRHLHEKNWAGRAADHGT